MKLDNRGWGLKEMIFLSCGLLIALLVSLFFISKLFKSLDYKGESYSYFNLETDLENAAIRYKNDNDLIINGSYKISYSTLKSEGYAKPLKDENGDPCGGYVIISNNNGLLNYEAYISCNDYVTEGY